MSLLPFLKVSDVYFDIGQTSLKVLQSESGLEIPLERSAQGRLTPVCAEKVRLQLGEFLSRTGRGRRRAICGVGARGISLRKLTLPPAPKENFERVLALQIEKDLPLSPDELAWGYYEVGADHLSLPGTKGGQELIVAAARKDALQEYIDLFGALGMDHVFTLGILAASSICPRSSAPSTALLDLGRSRSELIAFENGVPLAVRCLPWGGEQLTESIAKILGVNRDDAERFKRGLSAGGSSEDKVHAVLQGAIESLAAAIKAHWTGTHLYLVGGTARLNNLAPALQCALGGSVECKVVEIPADPGKSAVTLGLQRHWGNARACPLLIIAGHEAAKTTEHIAQPNRRKWAAAAVLLALLCLSIRYAEAYLKKPKLARRLQEIRSAQTSLPEVDRELLFLQYLETNQPPYLQALSLMAGAAPRGSRIDSVTFTRRGDFSARGTLATSQQATEFRSKLIDSGFFSNVVLEEQTPIPNQQQKVTVRVSARWKTSGKLPPGKTVPVTTAGQTSAPPATASPVKPTTGSGAATSAVPTPVSPL